MRLLRSILHLLWMAVTIVPWALTVLVVSLFASPTRIFQPPERPPTSPSIISGLKPRPLSTSRARASRL